MVVYLDVRMDVGEDGEGDKEDEEDVKQLGRGLAEDLPVRGTRLDLFLVVLGEGRVLGLQHFMVAVEFLEETRERWILVFNFITSV